MDMCHVIHNMDNFYVIHNMDLFTQSYITQCVQTVAAAGHDTQHVHIRDTSCVTPPKADDNNNISAIIITNKHFLI